MSVVIGVCYAAAVYLLLQRRLLQLLLGVALLGHGANLMIFVSSGLGADTSPLIAEGQTALAEGAADPLPQALILTAIVIGFGIIGFALAMAYRSQVTLGHDDVEAFVNTDRFDGEAH